MLNRKGASCPQRREVLSLMWSLKALQTLWDERFFISSRPRRLSPDLPSALALLPLPLVAFLARAASAAPSRPG